MKILVLGAGGMLGHKMAQQLHSAFPGQVFGSTRKPKSAYENFDFLPQSQFLDNLDVSPFSHLEAALDRLQPKWLVNCVGITLRKPEYGNEPSCFEVNAMLPHRLALWARKNDAKVIHFSTDCVFDGLTQTPYKDYDQPTAEGLYGVSKFLGEIAGPHSLTLRLSIIGRELENGSELVEWFLNQRGSSIKGFANTIYSGLSTPVVSREVERIIKNFPEMTGLYQVASQPISKYDLLHLLREHFDINVDIKRDETHISNKSLDFTRYSQATGFQPPSWDEMVRELAHEREAVPAQ
ncbi:MAG: NAD(P)-dependent oxidoreductase [Bdellovibrionaceae bacterium]|nr:NAD(P)-dependent oxidoreductase [Pseudobdellovibrionaceae bacterium]|tara:strand:- start:197 stop:1078 length:882 start_codon:yes stop_codon:yes gene_type:complete